MCILCVASRWSRRIVAMLPWLVIPLIILWALSQLLPPAYRFEVTSPRLACLCVILISLGWYEILMPRLSVWRARRLALMRERKRIEALEAAKWRKEATRRCRNCLTAYKEQNPVGGRFMCTYCGHISRRPVLDISNVVPDGGAQNAIGESGGKNIRLWDGKGWPSDWSGNSSWLGGSFSGIADCWRSILGSFLFCIGWVFRALCRGGPCGGDGMSNAGRKAGSKKGEDGFGSQVNRGEKARRKAEEKRLARLEKEMLEEEERKQREEVARLVEERRRLRDEKLEAEKEAAAERERENRRDREAEKKRQEKGVKEREKGWVKDKSHNDADEAKKRNNKENDRKSELDKNGEADRRESQKSAVELGKAVENMRAHGETGFRLNGSIKNIGARQLDSMKASTNSPAKSSVAHKSNGSSFWGKSLRAASSFAIKSGKPSESPVGSIGLQSKQSTGSAWNRIGWTKVWGKDSATTSKEVSKQPASSSVDNTVNIHSGVLGGNSAINGMDKNPGITLSTPSVGVDLQSASTTATTTIKSWHQLFSSSSDSSSRDCHRDLGNEVGRQNCTEPGGMPISLEADTVFSSPARMYFGSSSHIALGVATSAPVLSNSVVVSVSAAERMSSLGSGPVMTSFAEETTKLEGLSYVQDPISLLGPVSESLDNFSLDSGGRHSSERRKSDASSPEPVPIPAPINRPGPIESPVSKLLPAATIDDNVQRPPITEPWGLPSLCTSEKGKWQMWNSRQLVKCEIPKHPSSEWKNNFTNPYSENSMQVPFNSENHIPSVFSQQTIAGQGVDPISIGNSLWLNSPPFKPARDIWDEDAHHQAPVQETTEVGYNSVLSNDHSYEQPTNGIWSKSQAQDCKVENQWSVETSATLPWSNTTKPLTRPHIGGIYATPDVQSVWSYK